MDSSKVRKTTASGNIKQLQYLDRAQSLKESQVIPLPDRAIADATTAKKVGEGAVLRIDGGMGGGFLSMSDDDIALDALTLNAAAENTLKMPAGWFMMTATAAFIRTSAAVRIEVIEPHR